MNDCVFPYFCSSTLNIFWNPPRSTTKTIFCTHPFCRTNKKPFYYKQNQNDMNWIFNFQCSFIHNIQRHVGTYSLYVYNKSLGSIFELIISSWWKLTENASNTVFIVDFIKSEVPIDLIKALVSELVSNLSQFSQDSRRISSCAT